MLRRCSRAQTLLTCSTSVHTHYTMLNSRCSVNSRSLRAAQLLYKCCMRAQTLLTCSTSVHAHYTPVLNSRCLVRLPARCSSAPPALLQWSRTLLTCSTSDHPRCVGAQQLPPNVHLLPAVLACSTVAVQCAHTFSTLCSSAQRVLIEISCDLNGAQMLHKRPHSSNRCSPSPLDHLAAALVLRECCSTVTAIRGRASSRALS